MELILETLHGKNNLTDTPFFKTFARHYLDYLGNSNPTRNQLSQIQALLSDARLKQAININLCLSPKEKLCLSLSAQGKRLKQIACLLNLSQRKMSQCRQSILQKLGCKTMSRAVIICIRYGEIKATDLSAPIEGF